MRVTCLQMSVTPDVEQNWNDFQKLARAAASEGAALIAAPECCNYLAQGSKRMAALAKTEAEDTFALGAPELAKELKAWILLGSLILKIEGQDKLANRQFLISPDGELVSIYDKIHLFDVDVPDGQRYRESDSYQRGNQVVTSQVGEFTMGQAICFDMRFPDLFQALGKAGANLLAIPAAFTKFTGQAHWHTLLRARAIETGSFVIAPAQCGEHEGQRLTYGHSVIIAPWGEVLADAGEEPGYILADLDLARVQEARSRIPTLELKRDLA